ncbi:MAG: hypothetical protein J1E60_05180 [Christensenellaceae bacterium]|nr:hypothetical protein [Christensenellaceae bacterium]
MEDWRLLRGQIEYMFGGKMEHRDYVPPSGRWDHDHCEFCMSKFSNASGDLHKGYCMDNDIWVCESCFEDFKKMFNWTVECDQGGD